MHSRFFLVVAVSAAAFWGGVFGPGIAAAAEGQTPTVSVFVRDDCRHCRAEKAFLEDLAGRRDIAVRYHRIEDPAEHARFVAVATTFGLSQGTPITLVGETVFQGFGTARTTGRAIESILGAGGPSLTFDEALADPTRVRVGSSLATDSVCTAEPGAACDAGTLTVTLPFVGTEINLALLSLPAIAFTLGFVDGFNPCAMGVLIMFLTILLQTGSRRRMWQYAGLFLVAETLMYWAILMVWFSAWDFIGLSRIVTPVIGMLSLGSAAYFLYKWYTWKNVCTVIGLEDQRKLSVRIRTLAARPLTVLSAIGVIGIAFSVNIFEFACSVGIPQTFTKILEINNLGLWGTQQYMLIYILAYMVDDLVVFGLALYGFRRMGDTMRYSKVATLAGGIFMAALGLLMLLAPEKLVF